MWFFVHDILIYIFHLPGLTLQHWRAKSNINSDPVSDTDNMTITLKVIMHGSNSDCIVWQWYYGMIMVTIKIRNISNNGWWMKYNKLL